MEGSPHRGIVKVHCETKMRLLRIQFVDEGRLRYIHDLVRLAIEYRLDHP